MQFKLLIQKGVTLFLLQLTMVGDDVEDTMAPSYATTLEEFVDVF